jgi:hypothetical protein
MDRGSAAVAVKRGLRSYHCDSEGQFWKVAANSIFNNMETQLEGIKKSPLEAGCQFSRLLRAHY